MSEVLSGRIGASLSRGESALTLVVCCVGIAIYTLLGLRKTPSRARAGFLIVFSVAILVTGSVLAAMWWTEVDEQLLSVVGGIFWLTIGLLWPLWVFVRVAAPKEAGLRRSRTLANVMLCLIGCVFILVGCVMFAAKRGSTSDIGLNPTKGNTAEQIPVLPSNGARGEPF